MYVQVTLITPKPSESDSKDELLENATQRINNSTKIHRTVVEATSNHHSKISSFKEDLITKTGGMDDSSYPTMVEDAIHSLICIRTKGPTSTFNIFRQTTEN